MVRLHALIKGKIIAVKISNHEVLLSPDGNKSCALLDIAGDLDSSFITAGAETLSLNSNTTQKESNDDKPNGLDHAPIVIATEPSPNSSSANSESKPINQRPPLNGTNKHIEQLTIPEIKPAMLGTKISCTNMKRNSQSVVTSILSTRSSKRISAHKQLQNSHSPVINPLYHLNIDDLPVKPSDVHILSSLDSAAEQIAELDDISNFYKFLVFPTSFPWHNPTQTLLPTMPRDIDDHPGVLFAEHDYNDSLLPVTTNGKRGFRHMFNWCDAVTRCGHRYQAASRRAADPGVIDLRLKMVLNEKDDEYFQHDNQWSRRNISEKELWRTKRKFLINEGERAEAASCMPWHWSSKYNYSRPFQYHKIRRKENICSNNVEFNEIQKKMLQEEEIKHRKLKRKQYWTRNWKVSVKVGGVSSRSSIIPTSNHRADFFPPTTLKSNDETQNDEFIDKCSKVEYDHSPYLPHSKRHRTINASYPAFVQSGRSVLLSTAETMDQNGYGSFLGSYDVRFSSTQNPNSNIITKGKRVLVGRTRLIWTHLDLSHSQHEPSFENIYKKNNIYTSLLNNAKLDASAYKRPRDVIVTIKLNGKQFFEDEESELFKETSQFIAIGKNKNNQGRLIFNKEKLKKKLKLKISSKSFSCHEKQIKMKNRNAVSTTLLGDLKENNAFNAMCTFERRDYLHALRQNIKSNSKKRISQNNSQHQNHSVESKNLNALSQLEPMKYGATTSLKFQSPTFSILPLDDGKLRVFCLSTGSMNGCGMHSILNQASKKHKGERVCSVCWSKNTEPDNILRECVDCGLLVHLDCCADKGQLLCENVTNGNTAQSASELQEPLQITPNIVNGEKKQISTSEVSTICNEELNLNEPLMKGIAKQSSSLFSPKPLDSNSSIWRCSVCYYYKNKDNLSNSLSSSNTTNTLASSIIEVPTRKKLRRASKIPSRYLTENNAYYAKNLHATKRSLKQSNKYRPSWKCTLCPHSGGAMSPAIDDDDFHRESANNPNKWTHEVCRIWAGSIMKKQLFSSLSNVCALCGLKNTNRKDSKSTNDSSQINNVEGCSSNGLVKCAAHGCFVTFHPFCAMLVSKCKADENTLSKESDCEVLPMHQDAFGDEVSSLLKDKLKKDDALCKEYTLQLAEVSRREGAYGSLPGKEKKCIVPLAFCGIHNPNRDKSLYGTIPGKNILSSVMRIPTAQDINKI